MANMKIERRGKSPWPWIAGLLVLAALVWGVAELVETPVPQGEATPVVVEEGPEPAAIPAQASPIEEGGRTLDEIAPLGADDIGQSVRAEGEVVASSDSGFWLRTARGPVLHVRTARIPDEGRTEARGILQSPEGSLEPPADVGDVLLELELREPAADAGADTAQVGPGE